MCDDCGNSVTWRNTSEGVPNRRAIARVVEVCECQQSVHTAGAADDPEGSIVRGHVSL
jgi:hypothetical protein